MYCRLCRSPLRWGCLLPGASRGGAKKGNRGQEKWTWYRRWGLFCSFGLGVCFSLLGSLSVKLMPRPKIDQAKFGSLVTAFMAPAGGLAADRRCHRPAGLPAGSDFRVRHDGSLHFPLRRAKSYGAVFFACLLFGFGAMALNVGGQHAASPCAV